MNKKDRISKLLLGAAEKSDPVLLAEWAVATTAGVLALAGSGTGAYSPDIFFDVAYGTYGVALATVALSAGAYEVGNLLKAKSANSQINKPTIEVIGFD